MATIESTHAPRSALPPRVRKALIAVVSALTLSACAPYQPKVSVEQDPGFTADRFTQWNFVDPLAIEQGGFPDGVVSRFRAAVEAGMESRGYQRSESPQVVIDIAADLSGEGDASLTSDPYQAIHVQRGTFHESWRGYGEGYGASTRQQRYGDGRIAIGLIELQERTLLWEAVATGRLSGKRSEEEFARLIDSVTAQMLEDLPPAGN
jgi:hypothetical protein